LLARELRVPRVNANGLTGGATMIDVLREPPPPRPGGWTMRFERIVGEGIRHAYLNDLVLRGVGRAELGFVKGLRGGPMEVLPSQARWAHGTVWRDGRALARDTTLHGRFAIERHARAAAPGIRRLETTDLDLTLEATTAGLAIELRPGGKPVPAVTPGPGRIVGRVAWRHGNVEPGTTLALSVPVASEVTGERLTSEAIASLTVEGDGLRFRANLEPLAGGTVLADIRIADGEVAAGSSLEVPQVSATALALGNRFDGEARARIRYEAVDGAPPRPGLEAQDGGGRSLRKMGKC
jgi:hypothetical protein